jgi:phosphoglycolate phosphatase-like HAD superfamily hydrolase
VRRWRVRAIVLDFDGVLVDSNRIKVEAFFEALEPEHHPALRRALARGRELPRRALLSRILSAHGLRGRALQRAVAHHARRYSVIVSTAIARRGLIDGTRPLLVRLSRRWPLYVASTTPHRELLALLKRLGVRPLLRGACGWPHAKADVVRRAARAGASAREVVLVGDGKTDRRAAARAGCRFVGIANGYNGWAVDPGRNQIGSLLDLPALLERRSLSSRRRAFSSR